jgi:hypothetical protein
VRLYAPPDFADTFPAEQWAVFRGAIATVRESGAPFALGGGLAISYYTALWRRTKDIDLYVLREDRERIVEALQAAGLVDYYDTAPYDRGWIWRGVRDGAIVDVIWAMANGAGDLQRDWLACAVPVALGEEAVTLLTPGDVLWSKLHVLQRDRCDWPDLVNLLFTNGPAIDWERLLRRVAGEERLLAGLLMVFAHVAPGRACELPDKVWRRLGLRAPVAGSDRDGLRIDRLDSRPWFTPAP